MPRYFFEVEVNGLMEPDATGRELDDREAARKVTNDIMSGLIRSRDKAEDMQCVCMVRDEHGGHVYRHSTVIPAVTPEMLDAVAKQKARRAAARAARLEAQARKTRREP